jgi:8-oxo-dGTP diphosphatase
VKTIHVAVAVLQDAGGRVLVAQRLPHQHLAGLWEFPGGKLEPDETLPAAMARELHEELGIGIDADALQPLIRVRHDYPGKSVLLDVWRVPRWQGEPHGREGQPLRWLRPQHMQPEEFPPADVPIINALRLPALYLISPDIVDDEGEAAFVARAQALGASLVQLRLKTQPHRTPVLLARLRRAIPQTRVLVNSDGGDVSGSDGVHLTARQLRACAARPAGLLCGASCHDEEELRLAARLGLDFVTVSPVLATGSHPDAPALGWQRFAALARASDLPVYALGGMRSDLLAMALQHGAIGIAGITLGEAATAG